ncbi:MAG: hypothetical protein WCE69_01680 [Aestuariivirga sp.]
MFRKIFTAFAVTAALAAGMVAMASSAEAHRHRHHHHVSIGLGLYPFFGLGYPAYGYGYPAYRYPYYYDDNYDCRYHRIAIKKWNRSHTHRVIVYRKRLVCY